MQNPDDEDYLAVIAIEDTMPFVMPSPQPKPGFFVHLSRLRKRPQPIKSIVKAEIISVGSIDAKFGGAIG